MCVCACVQGSLALNLFHMTHTHMASVWTLSFCLSECLHLSLPPSLTLSGLCNGGKEVVVGGASGVGGREG